jgi:hypothetical protein
LNHGIILSSKDVEILWDAGRGHYKVVIQKELAARFGISASAVKSQRSTRKENVKGSFTGMLLFSIT